MRKISKTRMFGFVKYTCNPIVGCYHECIYCWARRQAKRLKRLCDKCYKFIPHYHMERIYKDQEQRIFKKTPANAIVFLCDMSDIFGWWVSHVRLMEILDFIKHNPQTTFFLETKNPSKILQYRGDIPKNVILSTTIETDHYPKEGISKAPPPEERVKIFWQLRHPHKHVSIEPIIDFDLNTLVEWIKDIEPEMVSIGYDNYGILKKHGIPEPSKEKYLKLKSELSKFTHVEDKTFRDEQ